MKLSFASLLSVFSTVVSKETIELPSTLAANSKLGSKLLSEARRLENGDDEIDLSWVIDYSIKFQGCHHITQWNADADGGEDVRIATKRLVRFRLCPTTYCDGESSGGCDSGYGDYIIDMNTYLQIYLTDLEELHEWTCEYYQMKVCGCDDDDGKDDGFDEEACLNNCFGNNGLDYCIEEENDDDAVEFELNEYMECAQFDDGGRRRRQRNRRLDGNEVEYFIGPYCSDEGGKVYLGMFTDDTCSEFADDYAGIQTYKGFTGETLPYSSTSIVGMECVPCEPLAEIEEDDGNANQDDAAEVEVKEACEQMYQTAGKCENNLNIDDPNSNACNYLKGVQITRSDGVVSSSGGSKSTAFFIGIFAMSTCLLGGYAFYLRSKLSS